MVLLKDTDRCMFYYTKGGTGFLKFLLSAKLVWYVCVCVLPPLRLPKISPSITKHSVHHMLYSTYYDLYITKNQCRSGEETEYNDVRLYRM